MSIASLRSTNPRLPTLSDIKIEWMRRRLSRFVMGVWPIIEPATPLVWNWHMDAICDHVQALVENKLSKNNLIINVPPGSSKSTIVSVCLPAWIWLHRPSYRGVFASGNDKVRTRDSLKCRAIMEDLWYRETFDIKWKFQRDQNAKLIYGNTATGVRVAATTGQRITGERYNGMFVDDALDAQLAFQQVEVDRINIEWWDNGAFNRVVPDDMLAVNQPRSTRCIIGQRLREDDICGHVIESNPESWEVLVVPQEWEEKQRRTTSLGWTDPRENEGDLMFPRLFPPQKLAEERGVLGQSGYEGQHQQRPSMLKGEIFKRGHAQFVYPPSIPTTAVYQTVISWDTAVKEKQTNDWSVSLVGTEFDRGVLVSEEVRLKTGYPGLKEATITQAARVRASALLIEDKQSGQQLVQELLATTSLPVVAVQVSIDKVARAWPLVPYWESNRVFFPCDAAGMPEPWVEAFLAELYSFPKAPHDDRVDAFTQLLNYLVLSGGSSAGIEAWAKGLGAVMGAANGAAPPVQPNIFMKAGTPLT
jgi:predicted phage terminase large subunit-like protein